MKNTVQLNTKGIQTVNTGFALLTEAISKNFTDVAKPIETGVLENRERGGQIVDWHYLDFYPSQCEHYEAEVRVKDGVIVDAFLMYSDPTQNRWFESFEQMVQHMDGDRFVGETKLHNTMLGY